MTAPVILFCYNRPWHLKETIDALKKNTLAHESDLFIFSDGGHDQKISMVRDYLKSIRGFRTVSIIEREKNYGLSRNIISGVTDVVHEYGCAIILEDDMVTSPYFLQYMNDALEKYENNQRVFCIHGYVFPIKSKLSSPFFIRGADCWGWATWKRAWDKFEHDGIKLLHNLKSKHLERDFDFDFSYPYTNMLIDQINGKVNSWAIRWYASAFLNNGLCLYPNVSLVKNIGNDSSGENCSLSLQYNVSLSDKPVILPDIPVEESILGKLAFTKYFLENSTRRYRLQRHIKRLLF